MMAAQWLITEDKTADTQYPEGTNMNAKGKASYNYSGDPNALTHKFRMKDDDGEIYYLGKCDRESFRPLDDFGAFNAGCTTIEYLNNGKWEAL